jgi:protein phosphatase 2C
LIVFATQLEEVSSSAETTQQQLGRSVSSCSHGDAVDEGSNAGSNDESSDTAPSGINCLMEEALRDAFLKTDEEFSKDGTAGLVGSTAVVALVGTHRVWIANCGDSRAVLSRNGRAIQVTDDHKPEREDEAVSLGWV